MNVVYDLSSRMQVHYFERLNRYVIYNNRGSSIVLNRNEFENLINLGISLREDSNVEPSQRNDNVRTEGIGATGQDSEQ